MFPVDNQRYARFVSLPMDLGIGPLAALKILKSVRLIRFPISAGMVSLSVPEPLVILRD